MTDEELKALHAEVGARCTVSCDEYHQHSALEGCLDAPSLNDPKDVLICKLCETLKRERRAIRSAVGRLGV